MLSDIIKSKYGKIEDLSLPPSSKGHKLYIKNLKGYPLAVLVRLGEHALEVIPDYIVRRYVDFNNLENSSNKG